MSTAVLHEIGQVPGFTDPCKAVIAILFVVHLAVPVNNVGKRPTSGEVRVGKFCSFLPAASHGLSSIFNK